RFRLPPHLASAGAARSRLTPQRAAAGLFGALGVTPGALTAATVVHLVVVFGAGSWISPNVDPGRRLAHRPLPSAERVEPVVLPPYVGPADLRRIADLRARETMRARARAAFIRDSIAMAESNRAAFVRDSTGNAELARLQEIRKRVERVIWFENDRQIPMSYRSI